HDYLYWEYSGRQAVRMGEWKAYRKNVDSDIELYNLKDDIAEQNDLAGKMPEVVSKMKEIMRNARTESEIFPLVKKK
ncbi:MAG: arylsulfatase, partial [Candidatus Aminicenantes bacterium]|nr:arylsulfatase [Candidatus Aminicenantes bacterium]